jgi:hypothetical protein
MPDSPERSGALLTNDESLRMIGAVYENVTHDIIKISTDKIYNYLEAWSAKMQRRGDWAGSLSVFCTVTLTLLTADFKDRFNVPKFYWLLAFSVIAVLSGIWLTQAVFRRLITKVETVNEMVDKFKNLPPMPAKVTMWQRIVAYYSRGHY